MTIVVFGGELIFPKKFHFQKFFFKVFYKIVIINNLLCKIKINKFNSSGYVYLLINNYF